ncbi:MAG: sensor histidine kinase [Alkalispirochaeta sp.]
MGSQHSLIRTADRSSDQRALYSLSMRIAVMLIAVAGVLVAVTVAVVAQFEGSLVTEIAGGADQVSRLVRELTRVFLLIYIVSLVIVVVIPLVLLRHLFFGPLQRLTFAVRDGQTDVLHDIARHTRAIEIHTMIASFAGLVDDAAQQRRELRRQVDAQTTQLREAQELIVRQEKLASLGQLAAGVAHEINNPSAFIVGNLEVLNEYLTVIADRQGLIEALIREASAEPVDAAAVWKCLESLHRFDETHETSYVMDDLPSLLAAVREGMGRITTIVKGLNSFARPSGDAPPEEIDLNAAVENAIQIVWNQLKYDYTLKRNILGHFATKALPGQIEQVIINILLNAKDASPANSEIHLDLYEHDGSAVIAITDYGEGIPADRVHRIFDPFYTTKPTGAGTGLGLSISHEIVAQTGGSIHVESTVGQGTRFEIVLPSTPFTLEELSEVPDSANLP